MISRIACCLALAQALVAAGPEGFAVWRPSDIKALEQNQLKNMDANKLSSQKLGDYGNHSATVFHREANGEAEVHEKMVDVFVVETGEATLVVGGKVVGGRTTGPGEIRGKSIEGGVNNRIAPGDIVHIPANTPHQVLTDGSKPFTYFVLKVATN
jgi:mannose-6-phosphate isomerase-like protein (cupin superfamily)